MKLGPSYEEFKKSIEEKEKIRVANEARLKETTKSLKKAKRKFNLKKCGVFVRYTLPTVLFLASTLGGATVTSRLAGDKTYEHTTSYYSSSEDSSAVEHDVYYSTNKENESPKLIFKGPWFKAPSGDSFDRPVYSYDLQSLNIDNAEEWIKNIDFNDIQAIINLLPTPSKSFESSYDDPGDSFEYEVFVSIDNVNVTKKVVDMNIGIFVAFCIVMLFGYIERQDLHRRADEKDKCFPNSLIIALENLRDSFDFKNICELEAEIESLKLSLSK